MLRRKITRYIIKFLATALVPLTLLACGGEEETPPQDSKWAERQAAFKQLIQKQKKMASLDFDREVAAPEFKRERTEYEIARETPRNRLLGVMGPETGELAEYGKQTLQGARLALEAINLKGGVKGGKIRLFRQDTKSTISGAMNAADAMINENVFAIIGSPTGEVTFSATKPLNDSRTILFSAGTRRRIGDTGIYHFRNTQADNSAISELVRYCVKERGMKNFAIFTSMVNDFSVKTAAFFKSSLMLQGGNIVKELFLWPKTTTYITEEESSVEAQISKLKGVAPDALIFTGDLEDGLAVFKAFKGTGVSIPVIAGEDLLTERFLKEAGALSIGTIAFAGFNPDDPDPVVRKFVKEFEKKYGERPGRIAALAYDAVNIVCLAVKNARSLRSGHIRNEILKIRDFHGVTGITSFTESGEVIKLPCIFEVKDQGAGPRFIAMTGYR